MAERGPDYRLDGSLARYVSAQVLLAVSSTHLGLSMGVSIFTCECNCRVLTAWGRYIHGQHPIPYSGTARRYFTENFRQPKISKVSRRDGQPSEKGVPEYLVVPIKFNAQYTRDLLEVQLIDFGGCKSFR